MLIKQYILLCTFYFSFTSVMGKWEKYGNSTGVILRTSEATIHTPSRIPVYDIAKGGYPLFLLKVTRYFMISIDFRICLLTGLYWLGMLYCLPTNAITSFMPIFSTHRLWEKSRSSTFFVCFLWKFKKVSYIWATCFILSIQTYV